MLKNKNVIVYGGGGSIGGAIAGAMARHGATVHLVGRHREPLERVAARIAETGGPQAHLAVLDVHDGPAMNVHAADVHEQHGSIDAAVNAVGHMHVQGVPLVELSLEDFREPWADYLTTNFLIAKSVASHMVAQKSGVILTISTVGSRMAVPGSLGYATTCGAIEAFSRTLAGEVGSSGVRVVCMRPDVIPEALPTSHVGRVFERIAEPLGESVASMVDARATTGTLLGRFPSLDQIGEYAAFAASDGAGALTAVIANLSCGSVLD